MSQNSNSNMDKNLKLMVLSASILVALFIYTIYKSSSHIEGTQYYIGLFFLFILLFAAFGLRFYKDKLKIYFDKKRGNTLSNFEQELDKTKDDTTTIKQKR